MFLKFNRKSTIAGSIAALFALLRKNAQVYGRFYNTSADCVSEQQSSLRPRVRALPSEIRP